MIVYCITMKTVNVKVYWNENGEVFRYEQSMLENIEEIEQNETIIATSSSITNALCEKFIETRFTYYNSEARLFNTYTSNTNTSIYAYMGSPCTSS